MGTQAIRLTRELLRLDTVNSPGNERDCTRLPGGLLESAGFDVRYHEFAPARTSPVARLAGGEGTRPLCLPVMSMSCRWEPPPGRTESVATCEALIDDWCSG